MARPPPISATAVEDSLSRLGTDRIDLYQLHFPDAKTPLAETIGTLSELVAEGKIREFGCSNFSAQLLEEAAAATPDGSPGFVSVQNQYNILHREPEDGVLAECERMGLGFLPFFPLASGLLSGKYRPGQPPPEGTRLAAMGDRAASQLTDDRLAKVASLNELAQRRRPQRARPRLRVVALPARRRFGHRRRHPARADRRQRRGGRSGGPVTMCCAGSTRSPRPSRRRLRRRPPRRRSRSMPRRCCAARTGATCTKRL